jgi:hypothetical protein
MDAPVSGTLRIALTMGHQQAKKDKADVGDLVETSP